MADINNTSTTAAQNLVIAVNSLNKTLQYVNGQLTSDAHPAGGVSSVRIYAGRSRVVAIVLLATGGTVDIYDSAEPAIIPASSLRYSLDTEATIGRYEVGVECKNGIILVVSGTSEANVTYSVY